MSPGRIMTTGKLSDCELSLCLQRYVPGFLTCGEEEVFVRQRDRLSDKRPKTHTGKDVCVVSLAGNKAFRSACGTFLG